jgi:hypothetical protein
MNTPSVNRFKVGLLLAGGLLASALATTVVSAADLGGNCCADLEERIAELEATTARKGNRKVSLTVSGWVSQQVLFWDDGREKNAYITDPGDSLATHVQFTGTAQINSDLLAGYLLHLEAISNETLAVNQNADNGDPKSVRVYRSIWFLKSKTLGQLSLGQNYGAADNQAFLVDGSGSSVPANYVLFDNNNFFLVRANKDRSSVNWGSLASCGILSGVGLAADCEGIPNNNIRYDSPVFSGFSGSASWGEDDQWALSGRWSGEFNSFKLASAVAYIQSNDTGNVGGAIPGTGFRRNAKALQTAGYIQHVPTGLFFYGAYGKDYNDELVAAFEPFGKKKDGDNFYLKAGIRQKWLPIGHTVLYGEYGENNDKMTYSLWNQGVGDSNISQWGLGVVQDIDAAAMQTWFSYKNFSADQTCRLGNTNPDCTAVLGAAKAGTVGFQEFKVFKMGGLIAF